MTSPLTVLYGTGSSACISTGWGGSLPSVFSPLSPAPPPSLVQPEAATVSILRKTGNFFFSPALGSRCSPRKEEACLDHSPPGSIAASLWEGRWRASTELLQKTALKGQRSINQSICVLYKHMSLKCLGTRLSGRKSRTCTRLLPQSDAHITYLEHQ